VAIPGSKYHYYRAVFLDYEDIIQEQKRALELMTYVPDEITQQVLNQIDDYVPPAPQGSPPYSPVVQSPPIMEYPGWTSETTSEPTNTTSEEDNDKPLVE
jgi:hypothetical protein